MNAPNDAFHGANGVSLTLEKQENGDYIAKCLSLPQLPPQRASDAATAIELQKRLIEKHFRRG